MKVTTSRFGELDIRDDEILEFPEGMIGFSDKKRFIIHEHHPGSPFNWLQSLDDGSLAFIVVKTDAFMTDYRPTFPQADLNALGLSSVEEAQIYVIVVVPEDPQKMYANLLGPVVINSGSRVARQLIASGNKYTTCHYILDELKRGCGVS
jgi:flagellar assembly factor FliW